MPRKTPSSNKGPSQRQLQVGEEIRHALVMTLQRGGLDDPLLMDGSTITIAEVKVSPDLRNATAYVMTLGGVKLAETLPALNRAAPYFQHEVGQKVRLKFIPKIKFVEDTTFAYAERIDLLLRGQVT
jgi:ribosome-binding factor A